MTRVTNIIEIIVVIESTKDIIIKIDNNIYNSIIIFNISHYINLVLNLFRKKLIVRRI